MVKAKWLYDIYDTHEKDYVIINAYSAEVTEIIGLCRENISNYSRQGTLYDDRYIISRKPIDEGIDNRISPVSSIPKYLWTEFENVTKDLRKQVGAEKLTQIPIVKEYHADANMAAVL